MDETTAEKSVETPQEESSTPQSGKLFENITEDGVVKTEYRLSDIDEYLKKIEDLSFIECASNLREVNTTIFSIQNLKSMLDGFNENSGNEEDSVGKEVALNNIVEQSMEESGLNAKDFYENYDHNLEVLEALKKALTEKVEAAKAHRSAKYINDEMISVLEKRIDRLVNSDNINKDYLLKRFNHVLEAFKNRTDWKWLHSKACNIVANKRTCRAFVKMVQSFSIESLKGLCKFSSLEELKSVEYNIAILTSDIFITQCIMVVLNKIALSEEKSGYDTYVKTLILNLLDVKSGIFDLCEDPNDYLNRLSQSLLIIGWSLALRIDPRYSINQKKWTNIDEYTASFKLYDDKEPIIYHFLKLQDSFIENKLPNGNVPNEWFVDYVDTMVDKSAVTPDTEVNSDSTPNDTLLDEQDSNNNEGENQS